MFLPIKLHKISKNKIILAILALFSTVIVILTPLISHSITVQQIPNPRQVNGGWVSDQANILSAETEAQLNKLLWQLKTNTGAEFAVVTVQNTSSASSPKEFATELFNYWGIGEKGKDNGLLWLHSVGDRRVEIETGYGLESILPDSRLGNIIRNEIIPKFKANDFNGGTLTGVQAISNIINRELEASLPGEIIPALPNSNRGWKVQHILSAITLAIGVMAYYLSYHLAKKPIYVSTWGVSQYQSFNSPSLALGKIDTENNFPIYFYLWFGTFLISLTLMGLFYLIVVNDFILVFLVIIVAIILGLLLIKPLAFFFDNNLQSLSLHPIHCERCRQPMIKLNDQIIVDNLSEHQKTAIKLGSVAFEAWQCENCLNSSPAIDLLENQDADSPVKLTKKQKSQQRQFHLRRYVLSSNWGSNWQMCPVGKELTVKHSSHVSVHPTQYTTGLEIITKVCQCCDYQDTEHHILPVLSSSSSSSCGYSSSDSGGYSGGSSGGDFGGGSSGGGGAGDSY